MTTNSEIGKALLTQAQFRLREESLPRILKCLGQLSEQEIWFRPNDSTVSIGNLVLHLCGNVRQWIIAGLGGAPDRRMRDVEFSEKGPVPTDELLARLNTTIKEACVVLETVDPATLTDTRHVQGKNETGVSIVVHVVEHFSYHTGQITYAVKSRKNVDLGYYAGKDLSVRGQ